MGYFLDDSRNFENFVKIWSRRPPDYHQNALKNTRKIMESSWKHIICVNMGHQQFRKFSKSVCPRYHFFFDFGRFHFRFFVHCFLCFFEYIFWTWFYEDEELETIHFSLLNSTPTWIWISFLSKNMNRIWPPKLCIFKECTLNVFQGRYPKLFYF